MVSLMILTKYIVTNVVYKDIETGESEGLKFPVDTLGMYGVGSTWKPSVVISLHIPNKGTCDRCRLIDWYQVGTACIKYTKAV